MSGLTVNGAIVHTRRLTVGDSIAVAALLFSALIWVGGWVALNLLDDEEAEDRSRFDNTIVGIVIIGPPLWAGSRVNRVIAGKGFGDLPDV